MRKLLATVLVVLGLPAAAFAQLGSVPYTFSPGTTILSSEVNANFSTIYANALNRTGGTMTGTLNVLNVEPGSNNSYALGSSGNRFSNVYSVLGNFSGTLTAGTFSGSGTSLTGVALLGSANTFTANPQTLDVNGNGELYWLIKNQNAGAVAYTSYIMNPNGNSWSVRSGSAAANSNKLEFVVDALGTPVVLASMTTVGVFNLNSSASGKLTLTGSGTSADYLGVTNTATNAYFGVENNAATVFGVTANAAVVYGDSSAGIDIKASNASGDIRFSTGGSNLRFQIDDVGNWRKGSNIMDSTGTPTCTDLGSACDAIAGTDYAMVIVLDLDSNTGTVNFGRTWTNAPVCVGSLSNVDASHGFRVVSISTTQLQFSVLTANSGNAYIICRGY